MKDIITLFAFILLFTSCTMKKECLDFRTGKFEYTNPEHSEWTVFRTDSTQIEISRKNGIKIYGSIQWKSDCEYVLTYDKIENSDFKDLVGSNVYVEITETKKNKYKCHSESNGLNMDFEMIKIE